MLYVVASALAMKTPLLAATLTRADQTRSFHVLASSSGWEVSESKNDRVVYRRSCADWHRLEEVLARFELEILELLNQGWLERSLAEPDASSVG